MPEGDAVSSDQGRVSDSAPITGRTKTTLGVIASVVVVLIAAFGYMENWRADQRTRFDSFDKALTKQSHRMEKLEESTERFMRDRWTRSDMRLWAVRLGADNNDLSVPEPAK